MVEEEDESNYMSPATSFDASKRSSKLSLTGIGQGESEENLQRLVPTPESPLKHEFVFDADIFDHKSSVSSVPTIDETVSGVSTVEESNDTKPTGLATSSPEPSAKESINKKNHFQQGKFFAKIQGKNITKFTPPTLPKLPKDDSKSKFSWTGSVKGTVDTYVDKSKTKFSSGEKVTTPYGIGIVVEHRHETKIVVIDMSGPWSARAYLQEALVKSKYRVVYKRFQLVCIILSLYRAVQSVTLVYENSPTSPTIFSIGMNPSSPHSVTQSWQS